MTGNWMQNVAQSWLVLQLTGSPLRLGLISTFQFAPLLLFSVFTGVVADRLPKRRVLVGTQSTQACLSVILAALVWSGHARYWHVAVMAVLWGLANSLDQPARQSFVGELVGAEDVVSAVGLHSAAFNGARIVGPAVAGVLIAQVGLAPGFAINAAAFAVSIGALLTIPARRPAPRRSATTLLDEVAEGVSYAMSSREVRFVLGLLIVVSFCVFNFTVYVPLLARDVLGRGAEAYGFLMTALGVGAVIAGLGLGAAGRSRPSPVVMAAALVVACFGLLGLGAVRHFWVAAVLLTITGFAGTIVVASCNTSLQLLAPDRLRGRVMSLFTLLTGGVFPLGAFCVGAVSQGWGVSTAFAVNGTLGLAAVVTLLVWWRGEQRLVRVG